MRNGWDRSRRESGTTEDMEEYRGEADFRAEIQPAAGHASRMNSKPRVPSDGGQPLTQSPFANLDQTGLPPGPAESAAGPSSPQAPANRAARRGKNRGRVDIIRQTAHRGGKTVTVVTGFVGIGQPEKERLAKAMQQACGTGGTVKEGRIEIQGDRREVVARILTEAGFRPVFAGG